MRKLIIIILCFISILSFNGCSKKSVEPTPKPLTQSLLEPTETTSTEDSLTLYMKTNNISLKAKDIQFDMKNNLDKNFAIEGIATLGTYYNYGFKDEGKYFCIKVNTDNISSNSWYLYCDRKSFAELFDILKDKNAFVTATCKISSNVYKTDQGNMAEVSNMEWKY